MCAAPMVPRAETRRAGTMLRQFVQKTHERAPGVGAV